VSVAVVKMALLVVALAAGGLYAMHLGDLSPLVGIAVGVTVLVALVPAPEDGARVAMRFAVMGALAITAFGLATVWATQAPAERYARILHDLGWTQAVLGGWMTYASIVALSTSRNKAAPLDDAARARWRTGDIAFGAELAGRIVVRAQPSWAALVVETAWPEPRPELVTEMLAAAGEKHPAISAIRARMTDKGGTDIAEARWELARIACDVITQAQDRPGDDVGGVAVGRFVLAAVNVVRDDEHAVRVFSALILPAVAWRP
jgi:hypothetical protein